jgi:glycosyltransferase involved in cell wall biosynthesis
LGIDDCYNTLKFVTRCDIFLNKSIKIFFFPKNVGPYIIRNSLAKVAKYDNILFFDSDDVMMENMVQTLLKNFQRDVLKFKFYNFNQGTDYRDLKNLKISKMFGLGVFISKKNVFLEMNGFFGWRCGADTEFCERYEGQGKTAELLDLPLFYRRYHDKNITKSSETGIGSMLRNMYGSIIVDNQINRKWENPKELNTFQFNIVRV